MLCFLLITPLFSEAENELSVREGLKKSGEFSLFQRESVSQHLGQHYDIVLKLLFVK